MTVATGIPPFPDDVPTAKISTIDFNRLVNGDDASSRAVFDAATGYGFFFLKNHQIDSDFMFDLADATFKLPTEELMKYDMGSTGRYFGYKHEGASYVDAKGTKDRSQFYNVSKDDLLRIGDKAPMPHPPTIEARRPELENFMRSCHQVIMVIARVLSKELGLGPELLPSLHQIEGTGGDQARMTHAPPLASDVISLGEHTDFGSITVLFNQLGGLQVLEPNTSEWKYVRPQPPDAIINLGDALAKLSGEKLYSGVHRVVGPPGEQAKMPRHSCVYFSRPNGNVKLASLFGSEEEKENAPTADEWIANRVRLRMMANYKGPETAKASRGTEHHARVDKANGQVEDKW